MRNTPRARVITGIALLTGSLHAHSTPDCAALTELALADARVTTATLEQEPVAHCKVTGVICRDIGFSVWLPERWNGRFVMGGAGGFVRPEDNQALRLLGNQVLERGFATASTDTGHRAGGQESAWARNDLEAIVNYGHLAMHRATVTSKAVVAGHYARAAEKSFFVGCSNGGRQALHEAQRYPDDFDGIVAGAPALNFTGVAAAFVQVTQHMFPDQSDLSSALVTPADRGLLRSAIEARCDAADGQADGILQDPRACDFDPASLQCSAGATADCLSPEKIAAIKSVYGGPSSSRGPLFFGFPFGAEDQQANGWGSWLTGGASAGTPNAAYSFGVGIMSNFVFHDETWRYSGYDWDGFMADTAPIAAVLNATDPDLTAFRAQGGKLLMFHGWADVALTAHMSTDYIERVYDADAGAVDDARLFMMPGVLHCYGGRGPSVVDWLATVERWHDTGVAPSELTARYPDKPGARKLCAWPAQAHYQGGDGETPAAYVCR